MLSVIHPFVPLARIFAFACLIPSFVDRVARAPEKCIPMPVEFARLSVPLYFVEFSRVSEPLGEWLLPAPRSALTIHRVTRVLN
jgi:hypothetical protein